MQRKHIIPAMRNNIAGMMSTNFFTSTIRIKLFLNNINIPFQPDEVKVKQFTMFNNSVASDNVFNINSSLVNGTLLSFNDTAWFSTQLNLIFPIY